MKDKNKPKDILKKQILTEKREREGQVLKDNFIIALRGNYIFREKDILITIFYILDVIWLGIFYLLISLFLSSVLDTYTAKSLENSGSGSKQNKGIVILEIIGQFILLIFVLYFTINIVPLFVPSISKKPSFEHKIFKGFIGGLFTTIGIMAGEHKLSQKIRYVFNTSVYKDTVNMENLINCSKNGTPFGTCPTI